MVNNTLVNKFLLTDALLTGLRDHAVEFVGFFRPLSSPRRDIGDDGEPHRLLAGFIVHESPRVLLKPGYGGEELRLRGEVHPGQKNTPNLRSFIIKTIFRLIIGAKRL